MKPYLILPLLAIGMMSIPAAEAQHKHHGGGHGHGGGGGGGGHHHHHHRPGPHLKPRTHISRPPATYPAQFARFGTQANYNTPYYRGGFRTNTAPYGFPATYQSPYPGAGYGVGNPYSSYGYPRSNRVVSYGTTGGFYPYTGGNAYYAYAGSTYSPYYQGQAYPGYRAYGVYGPNGAYTVPAGGVGTAAIQSRLLQAGLYAGPVDGFAGPLTRTAIQRYQMMWGLPVTGRIDGRLIQSMRQSSLYNY